MYLIHQRGVNSVMSNKPIIGLTYSQVATRDNEMKIRTYCSRKYYKSLQKSGAEVILLPPVVEKSSIDRYLNIVDAIVLPGGGDVDPRYQNEDPSPKLGMINPLRDKFELMIAKAAYNRKIPVLGICRGLQVMVIALGGKIYQDISDIGKIQHVQTAPRWATSHKITVEKSSILFKLTKNETYFTNSFHHQSIKELPKELKATAYTSDNIIEAIESADDRLYIGVQWHPEEIFETEVHSKKLFENFVNLVKNSTIQK